MQEWLLKSNVPSWFTRTLSQFCLKALFNTLMNDFWDHDYSHEADCAIFWYVACATMLCINVWLKTKKKIQCCPHF